MDSIRIHSLAKTPSSNLNGQNSVSFASNYNTKDTFESNNKKPKKSFFETVKTVLLTLSTLFKKVTNQNEAATPLETPMSDDSTTSTTNTIKNEDISIPETTPGNIPQATLNTMAPETTIEDNIAPETTAATQIEGVPAPMSDKEIKSEMEKFLEGPDFYNKIKQASSGKYQKNLMDILLDNEVQEKLKESDLTEEEFLTGIKKISKSTLKAALNNPTQYINYTQDGLYQYNFRYYAYSNGFKYPDENSEAGAYMNFFFKNTIVDMINALRYVDCDTLNQMMDKRTTSFALMLDSLNSISPENGELLKELISHTKEGDARQKIKLCQLVDIFQSNNFDTNLLADLCKQDKIDTSSLNEMFKNALIKKTGIKETDKTNTNFNEEYIHLLFSKTSMRCKALLHHDDDLQNLLKATVSGNFEEYILDNSNIYGKANKNTEKIFNEYGLDYENWLHPDFQNSNFDCNGKKMTLKIWERNPYEDLFIGNKTRCCTAIATGSNSASMPLYLLNTSFNYIELYDERNQVKGMARFYMSEIEGEPSVLIDSIELTDIKQMDDKEKLTIAENIFKYAKEFGNTITKKPTKVYYLSEDSHLPIDKNKTERTKYKFIGDVSTDKIYSNNGSSFKWDDIRKPTKSDIYKAA